MRTVETEDARQVDALDNGLKYAGQVAVVGGVDVAMSRMREHRGLHGAQPRLTRKSLAVGHHAAEDGQIEHVTRWFFEPALGFEAGDF